MIFRRLAEYFQDLEQTSSRLKMMEILAGLFKEAPSGEIDKIVYLLLGSLGPKYESIVFNIADKMMIRVIGEAYKIDLKTIRNLYKKKGDLGDVVEKIALEKTAKKKEREIEVSEVYKRLFELAADGGEGSQERKVSKMASLLSELDALSSKFVARIPVGRLRLGFSDKTILDGLSWMVKGDKSAKALLEKAYQVLPDPGLLAKKIKIKGLEKVTKEVSPIVGVPVLPMLAQRLNSPKEVIKKMGRVSVEPKLDGLRLSIHFKKGKGGFIKAFTRNLNETSWMFPELTSIQQCIGAREVILDSEAIGLDEKTKKQADFQLTMTRRRKHEIEKVLMKVGVEFFVFDILFKNGKGLMDLSYIERRKVLEKTLKENKNFKLVGCRMTASPEEIVSLYKQKISQGFEGILIKKTDSAYVPGRTGWRWVKMKQTEKSAGGLADTIDVIIMGYTLGKGKRAEFGLGQFLVGVKSGETIKTVTKIGTGLTDEQFREMKKRLAKLEVKSKPKEYEVHKNYTPDYWVKGELIVEIAADGITKSPTHTAGLALRFPRLKRFRDDKGSEEVTTVKEVERLYRLQFRK